MDVERTIESLRSQVVSLGHEALIASDAYTGFAVVTRERPDLIIMSLTLPGGSSLAMLERLRAGASTASTPVIILVNSTDKTGNVPKDPLVRLLQKPTNAAALQALFSQLLRPAPAPEPDSGSFGADMGGLGDAGPLPPLSEPRAMPMDMGAPTDDDLPPGETIEL